MISPAGNATALDKYVSGAPAHDRDAPQGFNRRVEFQSTIGDCSPETFIADMRRTRQNFGKESLKIETYHLIVSQTHEEADPLDTQAGWRQHQMVRAFVAEAFPGHQTKLVTQRDNGRFEVTENGETWVPGKWHTHCQIASVSEREATLVRVGADGSEVTRHYAAGRAVDGYMNGVDHLRRTADRVILRELGYDNAAYIEACRRHSAGEKVTRKDYALRADPDGPGYSTHDAVRVRLREARSLANDWDDYASRLEADGVMVRVTGTSGVSYAWIGDDGIERKARARGKEGLGSDFTKAGVEKQCQINAAGRAKGVEPQAPEPIITPPSPPAADRPVPVYLTPDGRPPWDADLDEYAAKVHQSGGTFEGRARQGIRDTIADPWVTDRDRLIAAAPDYGVTVEGRTGDPTVTVAAADGRGAVTVEANRLGASYTGRALDEWITIERNRGNRTDDRDRGQGGEAGGAAEQRPAEPGRIDSAAIADRRAANIRRAADQRAEQHRRSGGRPGGDTAAAGQQQPARDADSRNQGSDQQRREAGKQSATPIRDRLVGNPARPDQGRDRSR